VTALALTIKETGIVEPLGLTWLRDSKFSLIAGTRDGLEEVDGMDGAVDFGSEFSTGDITLELISTDGLSKTEINTLRDTVIAYLNQLRDYGTLTWEADPDKILAIRLNGKPSRDVNILGAFKISIPLTCQPIWVGETEHTQVGSGTLNNAGTFETPVIVEIRGPCTNPSVVIGSYTMTYTGSLVSSDILIIDTGALTATFNGVNALAFNGVFPQLDVGDNTVVAATGGTTIFKWFDSWI